MHLKTKIPIMTAVAIVIISTAAGFISIMGAQTFLRNNLTEDVKVYAESSKSGIENAVIRAYEASLILTGSPIIREWFTREGEPGMENLEGIAKEELLVLMTDRGYASAFAANEKTLNFYVGDALIGTLSPDDPDDDWFFSTLAGGGAFNRTWIIIRIWIKPCCG